MRILFAPLAAFVLLAASPSPNPSAPAVAVSPAADPRITVTCKYTPLYVFVPGNDRPSRSPAPPATLGMTFGKIGGIRTTLGGDEYYQTNVIVVEPGYNGQHYWIDRRCAQPS